MGYRDFHIHTTFSDGHNTPEEIVLYAISKNIDTIGFSDHSFTTFDESYCIKKENVEKYINEISALKEKYRDKISILCGIEQDYYSLEKTDCFDYVIGSVHYVKADGKYLAVDENLETVKNNIENYFNNNPYLYVEEYFKTVANVVEKTNADIIGHVDVVSKYNVICPLFDEKSERYVSAWKNAVDKLLKFNKPFEINTGAISRNYKKEPYPSEDIIKYIKENGGKFILTSDSHKKENICFGFDKFTDNI